MDGGLGEQSNQVAVVAIAEQAQAGRVDEADAAIAVDAEYAIADRAENAVELFALGFRGLAHFDGAGERAHTGEEQFARLVLEHALAGAGLQAAADDVLAIAAGDDRKDRRILAFAESAAQLVAAAIGQEVVDDDDVVDIFRDLLFGLGDRVGDIDRIAIATEQVAVGLADAARIVDEEDAHALARFDDRAVGDELVGREFGDAGRDAAELRPEQETAAHRGGGPGPDFRGFLVRHQQRGRRIRGMPGEFEQGLVFAGRPRRCTDDGECVRRIFRVGPADPAQVVVGFEVIADFRANGQRGGGEGSAQQVAQGGRTLY